MPQRQSPSQRGDNCGVSLRPTAGSAYASYTSQDEANNGWNKVDMPGGKKLYCRLVTAFVVTSILGSFIIFIGGFYFKQAYGYYKENGFSLPLTWCVIGLVCGCIMVAGSIILGKMIVSSKWRKNQQPVYASQVAARVRYTARGRNRTGSAQIDIEMPPPYDGQPRTNNVYIISAGNTNVNIHPGPGAVLTLPSYSEVSLQAPPQYTAEDPHKYDLPPAGDPNPSHPSTVSSDPAENPPPGNRQEIGSNQNVPHAAVVSLAAERRGSSAANSPGYSQAVDEASSESGRMPSVEG